MVGMWIYSVRMMWSFMVLSKVVTWGTKVSFKWKVAVVSKWETNYCHNCLLKKNRISSQPQEQGNMVNWYLIFYTIFGMSTHHLSNFCWRKKRKRIWTGKHLQTLNAIYWCYFLLYWIDIVLYWVFLYYPYLFTFADSVDSIIFFFYCIKSFVYLSKQYEHKSFICLWWYSFVIIK